jgi:hypothetical protein
VRKNGKCDTDLRQIFNANIESCLLGLRCISGVLSVFSLMRLTHGSTSIQGFIRRLERNCSISTPRVSGSCPSVDS